jgi:hypothetical protein
VTVDACGKFADFVPRLATPEVTEFSMSSAFIPEVGKVPLSTRKRAGTPRGREAGVWSAGTVLPCAKGP